jgi:hypothetical protein
MRKFFLISAVLLSATAAHAASDPTAAGADQPTASASSSAQAPDASAIAAKRQAMIQQQMAMQKQIAMQKQMAIQREMQLHPIRTRVHFALLKFERKLHRAF